MQGSERKTSPAYESRHKRPAHAGYVDEKRYRDGKGKEAREGRKGCFYSRGLPTVRPRDAAQTGCRDFVFSPISNRAVLSHPVGRRSYDVARQVNTSGKSIPHAVRTCEWGRGGEGIPRRKGSLGANGLSTALQRTVEHS